MPEIKRSMLNELVRGYLAKQSDAEDCANFLLSHRRQAAKELTDIETTLTFIKFLVCGDKSPRWQNDIATTITRGTIADECDQILEMLKK